MTAPKRSALQISAPKRRQLLEAVAHLLEAKKKIARAAGRASSGGFLLPIGGMTKDLDGLMGELLQTVKALLDEGKRA